MLRDSEVAYFNNLGFRATSGYGMRMHPVLKTLIFHTGIDLCQHFQAPIKAFTDGEVIFAQEGKPGSGFGQMGNVVAIKDKNNCLQVYAHLSAISVKVGDKVKQYAIVGLEGSTGMSTGSHLHYEVRRTCYPSFGFVESGQLRCFDPMEYLIKFYTTIDVEWSEAEMNEFKVAFDALNEKCTKLELKVDGLEETQAKLVAEVTKIKEELTNIMNEEVPEWNKVEMEDAIKSGAVTDPKGDRTFQRIINVMHRLKLFNIN